MRSVMRVIFVPVVRRNCHDPSLRESPSGESGRIAMTGLSNIEPCLSQNGDVIVGTTVEERRPWRTRSKAYLFKHSVAPGSITRNVAPGVA
jgi:hypothetical protein